MAMAASYAEGQTPFALLRCMCGLRFWRSIRRQVGQGGNHSPPPNSPMFFLFRYLAAAMDKYVGKKNGGHLFPQFGATKVSISSTFPTVQKPEILTKPIWWEQRASHCAS